VYVIGSFFAYGLLLVSLVDSKPAPTIVHGAVWLLALTLEIIRSGAKLALYTSKHRAGFSRHPSGGPWLQSITQWEALEVTVEMFRLVILLGLVILFGALSLLQLRAIKSEASFAIESETTSLLDGHHVEHGRANGHAYGTATPTTKEPPPWARPDRPPTKSWWEYLRGYTLFFPYLWPSKSQRLQLYFVLCFLLVCAGRVINMAVPDQVGTLTDELMGENGKPPHIPVGGICVYILYRYMQGANGLLGSLRSGLWIPISQYSYQELSVASFEHVHNLSYDFHMSKRIGEVQSALNKGNSINSFLETVTFQMVPMMADLVLALGYFLYKFDAYYALVVGVMTLLYLYVSIRMAAWRSDARREMTNLSRNEDAVK
jgi:ATP-binding cassette, subfamily B, vacuolar membrane transporter HMT1/ACLQ